VKSFSRTSFQLIPSKPFLLSRRFSSSPLVSVLRPRFKSLPRDPFRPPSLPGFSFPSISLCENTAGDALGFDSLPQDRPLRSLSFPNRTSLTSRVLWSFPIADPPFVPIPTFLTNGSPCDKRIYFRPYVFTALPPPDLLPIPVSWCQ